MSESSLDVVCNGSYEGCGPADGGSQLGHTLVICLVYGPVVLVTILGNLLVITAFLREPAIRCRVANYFIFSLSVADGLVGVSLGVNFVWLLTGDWALGKAPCLLWVSLDYCLCYASVLAIVLISLDRYRLVTLKLRYAAHQTPRRAVASIAGCWAFCLVFYPALVTLWSPLTGEYVVDYADDCDVESRRNLCVNLLLIVMEFVAPLAVLVYLNTRLYLVVRSRARGLVVTVAGSLATVSGSVSARRDLASGVYYIADRAGARVSLTSLTLSVPGMDAGTAVGTDPAAGVPPSAALAQPRRRLMDAGRARPAGGAASRRYREFHKHRKAAVTLSLLVGVYVLCWLPFYVKNTAVAFCGDCVNFYVAEVTDNLLWCNSTVNPFLYALLNMQYRRYIARVLRRLFCCKTY